MIRIRNSVEIALMTTKAGRRCARVSGRVASDTLKAGMSAGERERSRAVVKGRRSPSGCRMTSQAIVIKIIGCVIRVGHRRKVAGVARIARRRRVGVPGGMASQALQAGMATGQRELRLIMVESRRLPGARAVAIGAEMIETVGDVIRIGHRGKISCMTTVTGFACAGISLRMAGNTLQRCMRTD